MNMEVQEESLQNDEPTEEVINTEESATPEATPEPTPDEVEAEKKAKAQAAFNTQYGKTKQAERERDALQAKIDEAQQSQNQPPAAVGSFPKEEDYDYDTERFESAIAQYRQDIVINANYNAQVEAQNSQLQAAQVAAQQQQANADLETAQNLITKAKADGVTEAEIQQNAQAIISYGMQPDAFRMVMQDSEGHLMMKHLAANSQEVAKLNSMNPFEAGAYIMNVLKPQAAKLKPKTTGAPDPSTEVQGKGINPEDGKYKHLKGITYS